MIDLFGGTCGVRPGWWLHLWQLGGTLWLSPEPIMEIASKH